MTRREPNLVLWFFWCGVAGLLVASPFALLRYPIFSGVWICSLFYGLHRFFGSALRLA